MCRQNQFDMETTNYYFPMKEVEEGLCRDQLDAMMSTEQAYVVPLIPCMAEAKHVGVSLESWRRKICQWAFRVIDHFRLDREVVTIGMNIFDRFLFYHEQRQQKGASLFFDCRCPCCKRNEDPTTYQLAAMTSIFIAAKLASVQNYPDDKPSQSHFRLTTFADLSRGQFNMNDICNMERVIYKTVGWKVIVPSPIAFVSYYLLTLMPNHERVAFASTSNYGLVLHVLQELSRYLTEIATCLGKSCSHHRPSHVAIAAILVSMDLLTYQALPATIRDTFRRRVSQVCSLRSVTSLTSQLERALWPEMLLDNSDETSAGAGHPITVARNHGLLDLSRIYCARQHPLDTNTLFRPLPETSKTDSDDLIATFHPETSPVSTVR